MFSSKHGYLIPLISGLIIFITAAGLIFLNLGGIFGPEKTIFIKFKEPGTLPRGMSVYFKGIEIGKVTKMDFSSGYESTILEVGIRKKDFNPPNNIYAEIKIEGEAKFWAQGVNITKYVELIYPEKPSSTPLKDGDVIEGRPSGIERIQDFFKKNVDKKNIKSSVNSVQQITQNAGIAAKNLAELTQRLENFLDKNSTGLNQILDSSKATIENVRYITFSLREFTGEEGLKVTLNNLAGVSANLNLITSDIAEVTGDYQFRCLMAESPVLFKNTLCSLTSALDRANNTLAKVDVTLNDADRLMNRYDCFGACMSDMLSKRFLGLRLLFGKPGEAFEVCKGVCPPNYSAFNFYSYPMGLRPHISYPVNPGLSCPVAPCR